MIAFHEMERHTCSVRGVELLEFRHVVDSSRGNLSVGEYGGALPFLPLRFFVTSGIPSHQVRGEHAHRRCSQLLICTHGECHVLVDDGEHCEEFCLNRPTLGILIPPLIWATEHLHSEDSALLVLASRLYEPEDYIRDYRKFLTMLKDTASPE